ncbi:MAG: MBL fold metallo-hydrolase [Candidatus Woesearchaeota archaeon]
MKVVFLGVGEAFDEHYPTNCHLIVSNTKLLLDCGFSAPQQVWKFNPDQSYLDAVFISHCHADHHFGLPSLLNRMEAEGRTKKLTIICQNGSKELLKEVIKLGYPGLLPKLEFKLNFIEVVPGQTVHLSEMKLSFATTAHSLPNLAIRVEAKSKVVCYSGDGQFNHSTRAVYSKADLLIHEAYLYSVAKQGHGTMVGVVKLAEQEHVKCVALTHIDRFLRAKGLEEIKEKLATSKVMVLIPEPLEQLEIK